MFNYNVNLRVAVVKKDVKNTMNMFKVSWQILQVCQKIILFGVTREHQAGSGWGWVHDIDISSIERRRIA